MGSHVGEAGEERPSVNQFLCCCGGRFPSLGSAAWSDQGLCALSDRSAHVADADAGWTSCIQFWGGVVGLRDRGGLRGSCRVLALRGWQHALADAQRPLLLRFARACGCCMHRFGLPNLRVSSVASFNPGRGRMGRTFSLKGLPSGHCLERPSPLFTLRGRTGCSSALGAHCAEQRRPCALLSPFAA